MERFERSQLIETIDRFILLPRAYAYFGWHAESGFS
jgi:hypothetical protein